MGSIDGERWAVGWAVLMASDGLWDPSKQWARHNTDNVSVIMVDLIRDK